jgi:hypothetical protein
VDSDEDRVGDEIDRPGRYRFRQNAERLDVAGDEGRDRCRSHRVLDEDRHACGESAQWAERSAGEAVAGAGSRQSGGEFGEAEYHAHVHESHEEEGDEQAAPAAFGQPEVPAGEVSGDDVGDAEAREEDPAGRALLQLSLFEVVLIDIAVFDVLAHGCPSGFL